VKGVTLRHDPKRKQPFGVFVKVAIGDDEIRSAKFYATEAAARVGLTHAETEVQRLRDQRDAPPPAPDTLAAYAVTWLDLKTKLKPATAYSYEIAFRRHINPIIGATPIAAVDVDAIDRLRIHHTKAGMRSATLKRIMLTLSSCLSFARRRGKIATNPAEKIGREIGSADDEQKQPNPLPPAAAAAFLAWVQQHAPGWSLWFLFLIRTGARIGEASALQWDAIDWAQGTATIRFSFSNVAKRRSKTGNGDGPTKTWRQRPVELSAELIDALRDEQARQRKAALAAGQPLSDYVFLTPARGVRVLTNNPTVATVFKRGLKAIGRGVHGHTLHDLRDTFATMHLTADPRRLLWISATLGHKTPQITLTRYAKHVKTLESDGFASSFDSATAKAKAAIDAARN
jgi:integrase